MSLIPLVLLILFVSFVIAVVCIVKDRPAITARVSSDAVGPLVRLPGSWAGKMVTVIETEEEGA